MIGSRRKSKLAPSERGGELVYDGLKWLIMLGFAALCLLPMVHLLGVSLAPVAELRKNPFLLWPARISFDSYKIILGSAVIPRSLVNSFIITILGVVVSMALTSVFAYGLSKRSVPGNKLFNLIVMVFIVFQVGIIPLYITVRNYGLIGSYFSIILVSAINPFWCIIMRNFFEELPQDLFEMAKMEGASEYRIFFQIALPISTASFAAITLFYAVFFWNDYFIPLMFISAPAKWPVTVWLYQMLSSFMADQLVPGDVSVAQVDEDNIKSTVIFVSIVPIIMVYPFLQKHFAQGVTLGAVKG